MYVCVRKRVRLVLFCFVRREEYKSHCHCVYLRQSVDICLRV
jgi:hypothetical protein